jgi:hypothetical protein
MATQVTIRVLFPDGSPVVGASIRGIDTHATGGDRDWFGTTGADGTHTWTRANTGVAGNFHNYEVTFVDAEGIKWVGKTSERILTPVVIPVTLRPAYSIELELPRPVVEALGASADGRQILEGMRELKTALGEGLLRSPVVLATWVLEGLIRIKAKMEGKWKEGYSEQTFGQLIANREILEMFPTGLQPRVKAVAAFRTPAAHNTGAPAHVAEGQLAASVAVDSAVSWFTKAGPVAAPVTPRPTPL